jgi:hypothetical protein
VEITNAFESRRLFPIFLRTEESQPAGKQLSRGIRQR